MKVGETWMPDCRGSWADDPIDQQIIQIHKLGCGPVQIVDNPIMMLDEQPALLVGWPRPKSSQR